MPKYVSPAQYLQRAVAKHGGKYTYDESTLLSSNALVPITCPIHGVFEQKLGNHLHGAGCPKCAGFGVDWVARFKSVHADLYDYSLVKFTLHKAPVDIICREHGVFQQTPDNHYRGAQGCPKCKGSRIRASKQLPFEEFARRAAEVHKGRFQYPFGQFTNLLAGGYRMLCPLHGEFTQSPVNHLAGKVGCTKCNHMKSSGEDAVFRLVSTFAEATQRNRTVLAPKELDIYIPSKQLAIEYCGMYWHSHKDLEDERKNKRNHYNKYAACKSQGIRLLTIYESEWQEHNYAIRRLIRNAIGKSKGKLMARKCELRKVTVQEARAFYDKYHPQGGNGHGEHYALFWNNKMVACMRFVLGANDRGVAAANRVWTLGRYATRVTVAGAASRLFKAFLEEFKPSTVKSFSDNRFFDGGMYEQLGFVLEEEVPPDYQVWSPKSGLLPKTHYQRRNLPTRLKEHGVEDAFDPATDTRTEAEMTYLMGARRIYDCGKKRWVWTSPL